MDWYVTVAFIIGSTSLSWNTLWGKNGLHAFGYNSAESEPIWMKSGTVWARCWELFLADFGRDPRSGDSLKAVLTFETEFWKFYHEVLSINGI